MGARRTQLAKARMRRRLMKADAGIARSRRKIKALAKKMRKETVTLHRREARRARIK
jgi:hypothetical protein